MSVNLVPTAEQIDTLRELFLKKLEREGTPFEDGFDKRDIDRIKTSNAYLSNYLEHLDLNMKQSLQMLWDTCIWRKTYGTNDITESNLSQQHLHSGIMFPHNQDLDGKTLLICRTKLHQKGRNDVDDLVRLLVYWVERLQREQNYTQVTLVFDMSACGLSNMDMDFTKRTVDTFKYYYPNSLNYILIYDLPWILTAAFKIVKALLPPKAASLMRFVNEKSIGEYVDSNNALTCWGGKDDYVYSFIPENQNVVENHLNNNCYTNLKSNSSADELSASARKVHFANSSPLESPMSESSQATLTDKVEVELLRITPDDAIIFTKSGNELVGNVDILNISPSNVTYKIKTTSPEKFRVRPSSGCLSPNTNTTISVVLQQGQSLSSLNKDKFLVMSMALDADIATNTQAIADLWKNTPPNSPLVEQRRLKCTLPQQMAPGDGLKNGRLDSNSFGTVTDGGDRQLGSMLSQLTETTIRLEHQIKFSQNLQWITLCVFLLLSMAVVYILKQEINQNATGACTHSEL